MTWVRSSKNNFKFLLSCLSTFNFVSEMITEDFPKSTIKSCLSGTANMGTNKPSADTVDLTIDSDEDEEPKKSATKGLPAVVKAKTNGM